MADKRFGKTVVRSQLWAVTIAVLLFAPRIALSDCCNCTFDLGPPNGVVPFCQGNDLSTCPIASTGFNCQALIAGGTCSPSNNVPNSTCTGPPASALKPAPAVSNHNMVFLSLTLLFGGLWMVRRRLPRRH